MARPTFKKLSKSTKYYILCGFLAILLIISLLLLWAWIGKVDILAWLTSKYAFLIYGALIIYITIGVILYVRDVIKEL